MVAVDGSPQSDAAVEWAARYADSRHAPLAVVHGAGRTGVGGVPSGESGRDALLKVSRPVVEHTLSQLRRTAPGCSVKLLEPLEDPRTAVLEASADACMVVLGTRGRGPVKALLLGSVSQAVATHAPCPVTVVRTTQHPGPDAPVVVGLSLQGSAQPVLDLAFELASLQGRRLEVVHAWEPHNKFIESLHQDQLSEVDELHQRDVAEELAGYGEKFPDVAVTREMADGSPVDVLVARSATAAHVVVGHRDRHVLPGGLGSVSRAVLEHAQCPVTVARPVAGTTVQDGPRDARGR